MVHSVLQAMVVLTTTLIGGGNGKARVWWVLNNGDFTWSPKQTLTCLYIMNAVWKTKLIKSDICWHHLLFSHDNFTWAMLNLVPQNLALFWYLWFVKIKTIVRISLKKFRCRHFLHSLFGHRLTCIHLIFVRIIRYNSNKSFHVRDVSESYMIGLNLLDWLCLQILLLIIFFFVFVEAGLSRRFMFF